MQTSDESRRTTWPFWERTAPAAAPQAVSGTARVLLGVLRVYKLLLSPFFSGYCRFHPSCADYASQAIVEHGAMHGTWLSARRLARCRPLGGHGFDPVPHR